MFDSVLEVLNDTCELLKFLLNEGQLLFFNCTTVTESYYLYTTARVFVGFKRGVSDQFSPWSSFTKHRKETLAVTRLRTILGLTFNYT